MTNYIIKINSRDLKGRLETWTYRFQFETQALAIDRAVTMCNRLTELSGMPHTFTVRKSRKQ